ncbi:hypothetical protein C1H46_030665 [Malus baccata]|uniref:Uncharacterized protein n=1 Tax=Malus baccata TaxID=106549 RepID=A0A540LBC4_MALBA|nr:hypothetical protein C1H46_030665 [Malus baccata]
MYLDVEGMDGRLRIMHVFSRGWRRCKLSMRVQLNGGSSMGVFVALYRQGFDAVQVELDSKCLVDMINGKIQPNVARSSFDI